jgi:PAS domain S-box-containing protein
MHDEHSRVKLSYVKLFVLTLIIATAYILAAEIGLLFSIDKGVSSLWPPSGLALALILIFGAGQAIPGIILGLGCYLFYGGLPGITSFGLMASALIECIMSTLLLRSIGHERARFQSGSFIFSFILVAAYLSPFISSTVGITFLHIGHVVSVDEIPKMWITFFVGNSLGVLLFGPFIISMVTKPKRKMSRVKSILSFIVLGIACYWSFSGEDVRKFLIVPILLWISLQGGLRAISFAILVSGLSALIRSVVVGKAFVGTEPHSDLLWVQLLVTSLSLIGYFLLNLVKDQEEAKNELSINLQHKKIAEEGLAILDQSINKLPIGFALLDREYKYIRINEILASYDDLSAELHIGRTIREVLPERADIVEMMIDKIFATGRSYMNINYVGVKLSKPYPISGEISYYPVKHPVTNEIFGVGITIKDMTDAISIQNLLQENQDFLTFAQQAGKIGAFDWNLSKNHIFWTTELETIYGLEPGEFSGDQEGWLNFIHPEDRDEVTREVGRLMAGEGQLSIEFRIISKREKIIWILARGKLIYDNHTKKIKIIGINIDVTEQKEIEHKLRLTETNLLHALSVRDEFMAIASHELKTPLTSLKLQNQMFYRNLQKNDPAAYSPEKIRSLLDKNSRHIDQLTRLVDDMLDISRIRTGRLTLKKETCDIKTMLQNILYNMRDQFAYCGSGQPLIEQLEDATGDWDPLRIEQVITNIITNAVRYGQGRPITIAVQNHHENVRISVKDEGLGIERADHEKIFQRYERGVLTREVRGLGIGLFITQQIVNGHQGRIWLESEVNRGTTFYVDLPRLILSPSISLSL